MSEKRTDQIIVERFDAVMDGFRSEIQEVIRRRVDELVAGAWENLRMEVMQSVMRTYASRIAAAAEEWIDNIKKENGNG